MRIKNGRWFPLVVGDFYGPRCSQHPFDPYSLVHILHGFVFYVLLVRLPGAFYRPGNVDGDVGDDGVGVAGDVGGGSVGSEGLPDWWIHVAAFVIGVALEVSWEIFENSEYVINKYRQTSGVSGDYTGDSIQNSLGDVVSASLGYWICVASARVDRPWIPPLWFIITELALTIKIRDGLILTIIQMFCTSKRIKKWQKDLIDQREKEQKQKQELADPKEMEQKQKLQLADPKEMEQKLK